MINVIAYTDGSCRGNPGPSGYGVVLINETDGTEKEICTPMAVHTDCNLLELLAARRAMLECKKPRNTCLIIYTDNLYTVGTCHQQFKKETNKHVVKDVIRIMAQFKYIDVRYVRGHDGDPMNMRAHTAARHASSRAKRNKMGEVYCSPLTR